MVIRFSLMLFLSSLFIVSATAQEGPIIEDYSVYEKMNARKISPLTHPQQFQPLKFDWLYELLIADEDRNRFPKRSRKSFDPHMKDSFDTFPHPDKLVTLTNPIVDRSVHRFKGTQTYVVFFPRDYRYDVYTRAGETVIEVRIHFKEATTSDHKSMGQKITAAQMLWNRNRPEIGFPYRFSFHLVKKKSQAHFSVRLKDSTRGPYDVEWARNWNNSTVAHEIGHMLGLGDEYQTLTGTIDCLRHSIMCDSWSGELMEHHYYQVLKRFIDVKKAKKGNHSDWDEGNDWDF